MSAEETEAQSQARFPERKVKHYVVKNNYAPPAESFLAEAKNSWTTMTYALKFLSLDEATKIAHKHEILTHFFTKILAIDEKTSDECACKIEHAIPDKVLERFIEFINFEEKNPTTEWIEGVGFTYKTTEKQK